MKSASCVLVVAGVVEAFNGPGVKPSTPASSGDEDHVKAVMHDFVTADDCFGGMASRSTDCWTGADGVNYRYACKKGDSKIYADICETDSCDPSSCLGEWAFHEEVETTCYSDGPSFYRFQCTELGLDEAYDAQTADSTRIVGSSAKTCQALGWDPSTGKSPFVCAASKIDGACHDGKTYAEAEAACTSVGARLCTSNELSDDEAKGTGCKADSKNVWTSDECAGGHTTQGGAAKGLGEFPISCSDDASTATVRCCADAVNTVVGASSGLPAGYRLATASDFAASDSNCGGESVAEYSCWTNPDTGMSQRFACTDSSKYVWSQMCGSDTSCAGASCSGEWFNTEGELLERCYQDPSGGLYSYTC